DPGIHAEDFLNHDDCGAGRAGGFCTISGEAACAVERFDRDHAGHAKSLLKERSSPERPVPPMGVAIRAVSRAYMTPAYAARPSPAQAEMTPMKINVEVECT